ncbi:MAG: hypothetical protein L3J07_03835 [Candidatus Magasanikbacteria bacterium]|nr:hypothetical protein [Candidatus Magasanikbacteria bacterium]
MNGKQDVCKGHNTEQYPAIMSWCEKCGQLKASKTFLTCKKCAKKNSRCHICGKKKRSN